ncbi:hexosyltransferase/Dolichyl-diphosphooligosaccharide--protein glycotransferase, partial [Trypanosoma cruzi]
PEEPQVRRARAWLVHWAVPASEGDPRRCWRGASTTASWRTSTAANEMTRTTVRTCVASAMKGVARGRGKCALERKLDSRYVFVRDKGRCVWCGSQDDLPHPTIFLFWRESSAMKENFPRAMKQRAERTLFACA